MASNITAPFGASSAVESSHIADQVHGSLSKELLAQFEDFLERASLADLYFMDRILLLHDGLHAGDKSVLPECFADQVN
jgi:hypothetical protein